jgi:hypothetical protein
MARLPGTSILRGQCAMRMGELPHFLPGRTNEGGKGGAR